MSAILKFDIALIHVDLEEMSSGSEYLLECMELLKGKELRPETIVPVISALNQLGILYAQWEQQEKAKTFLVDAERLYKEFTNTSQVPVSMGSLFDVQVEDEGDPGDLLDKLHILTTYYLAQVSLIFLRNCVFILYVNNCSLINFWIAGVWQLERPLQIIFLLSHHPETTTANGRVRAS